MIPPILEKFDVPLAHRYLMAYALAYVNAFDRAKGRTLRGPIGGFRRAPLFAERTHRLENPGKFLLELAEVSDR